MLKKDLIVLFLLSLFLSSLIIIETEIIRNYAKLIYNFSIKYTLNRPKNVQDIISFFEINKKFGEKTSIYLLYSSIATFIFSLNLLLFSIFKSWRLRLLLSILLSLAVIIYLFYLIYMLQTFISINHIIYT